MNLQTCILKVSVLLLAISACKSPSGEKHMLSIVIDSDSLHVYHGKFTSGTDIEHYSLSDNTIVEILTDNQRKYSNELTLKIKPGDNGAGDAYKVVQAYFFTAGMAKEKGIPYEASKLDSMEQAVLHLETLVLRRPEPLELYLPDGKISKPQYGIEEDRTAGVDPTYKLTLVATKAAVLMYQGELTSRDQVKTVEYSAIPELLQISGNLLKDSVMIVIKPAASAEYKDIVDLLDQMSINNIKRYALVDITPEEEKLLNIQPHQDIPPFPFIEEVKTTSYNAVLTKETAELTLILLPKSLYYMMGKAGITKPIKIQSFTVAGVLEAIEAAESKYGKKGSDLTVIIQGDNNANYNDFKLVINALKQKEMFKFKVSTDPIQIN